MVQHAADSETQELSDATAFTYREGISARFRGRAVSVQRVGSSREADVHAEDSETRSFQNTDERNPKLSKLILETGSSAKEELK